MDSSQPIVSLQYFSGQNCGVCHALKPKVLELLSAKHPSVKFGEVKVEEDPETAAQNLVFTLPVVIIRVDDQEAARYARSFSIHEIDDKLERLKTLLQ